MKHRIKLRESFCTPVCEGKKNFEIRKNDRGYQAGDYVTFEPVQQRQFPYDPTVWEYFPHPVEEKLYRITYVMSGWGIEPGFVVFGIEEVRFVYENEGEGENG